MCLLWSQREENEGGNLLVHRLLSKFLQRCGRGPGLVAWISKAAIIGSQKAIVSSECDAAAITRFGKVCCIVSRGTFGDLVILKGHEALGVYVSYIMPFQGPAGTTREDE